MLKKDKRELTYKEAGVDIEAGNRAVRMMQSHLRSTFRPEVIDNEGGFAGLFACYTDHLKEPVLVSAADGVGTKLRIAFMLDKHDTVGIDLVAMCVNDIIVCGAEPLFFLDYIAVSHLDPDNITSIISGIAAGCRQAGCALIGGETAELPEFYKEREYDLAGFAVGIVEREKIIDGSKISPGDKIIGLAGSGLHSSGYSLVRKVLLEVAEFDITAYIPLLGRTLGEELLEPTKIYVNLIRSLLPDFSLKGIAHITGGGFPDNIVRILPLGVKAVIDRGRWEVPPIFDLIRKEGNIRETEMFRTFNMGIGMILVVPAEEAEAVATKVEERGERAYIIGHIEEGERGVIIK